MGARGALERVEASLELAAVGMARAPAVRARATKAQERAVSMVACAEGAEPAVAGTLEAAVTATVVGLAAGVAAAEASSNDHRHSLLQPTLGMSGG